jgi:hypothetical protein
MFLPSTAIKAHDIQVLAADGQRQSYGIYKAIHLSLVAEEILVLVEHIPEI